MIEFMKLTGDGKWIVVDMQKLYETQKVIFNKWRADLPDSPIQNINNYTLHTIEELYESENAPGPMEKLEETIDSFMYLMSSISAYELDPKFNKSVELETLYLDSDTLYRDVPTVQDIINKLMDVRRMYPERKWHKPFNPDEIDYYMRSKLTIKTYMEAAVMIIKRMYINFDMNDTYFINAKLNKKQGFIKTLEDDKSKSIEANIKPAKHDDLDDWDFIDLD